MSDKRLKFDTPLSLKILRCSLYGHSLYLQISGERVQNFNFKLFDIITI